MKHLIALLLCASGVYAQALTGQDVSFMDWNAVDPAGVCERAAGADAATIHTLRRSAQFEALHNSHGGGAQAAAILECLDAHGVTAPVADMASKIRTPKAAARKPSAPKRRSSVPAPAAGQ